MKKGLLVISMMIVLAITMVGCATQGDLEKVQARKCRIVRKLIRQRWMRRLPRRQPMRPP